MAGFVKGEIVVIPFPFSDLSGSKRRPALVLSDLPGDDIILCQITSQHTKDKFAIPLTQSDLQSGSLITSSFIRPNRIFTADKNIIIKTIAISNKDTLEKTINSIVKLLTK